MERSGSILIFDGGCGFCTRSARWIERRWPEGAAAARPSQSFADRELEAMGLRRDEVEAQVCWFDGEPRRAARAVAAALVAAGGSLGLLGRLIDLPPLRWPATLVYRIVARWRHRLPGATEACALPSARS